MNKDLELLISLQQIDLKIYELEEAKSKIPEEIEDLRSVLKGVEEEVNHVNSEIEELKKSRKKKEGDVGVENENLKKTKLKLTDVKTNKEYAAVLTEISTVEEKIGRAEDEILEIMEATERKNSEYKEKSEKLKQEEARFNKEKEAKEKEMQRLQQLLDVESGKRKEIEASVNKRVLSEYERIRELRGGVAVIPVKKYVCQGCYMSMPPQIFNDIKTNGEITHCSHCSRILYRED